VVAGVTRRVEQAQRPAAAEVDAVPVGRRDDAVGGRRVDAAVDRPAVAVHGDRPRQQAPRLRQVAGAALVHHHRRSRECVREDPGRAAVVEVDVGRDDPREVVRTHPAGGERGPHHRRGRPGPGVDEGGAGTVDEVSGGDARPSRQQGVDHRDPGCDLLHGRIVA